MRIAFVLPYVKRVWGGGSRFVLGLARTLASRHEVTVYSHTVYGPLEAEVRSLLGRAEFRPLRLSRSSRFQMRTLLALQLLRGRDRALSSLLHADHAARRFDAILVAANEGHWLGGYIQSWGPDRPLTAVWVFDLLDQVFLLGNRRPAPRLRRFFAPLYPLLHSMEAQRLAAFDLRFALSQWTSQLVTLLYGLPITTVPPTVDGELFRPTRGPASLSPYVAVPTVSLDGRTAALVEQVRAMGIPMISYGPRPVAGVPHRGFVTDSAMVSILAEAQGTLFLFDYEAFGLVPVESLACGTPVVTLPQEGPWSELRGNPDVLFGTTAEEIAHHCKEFLALPKSPEAAARRRASVARFFPDVVAQQLEQAFQDNLARRAG